MPIPREQFDKGLTSEHFRVLNFLKSRATEAFTIQEIWTALGEPPATDFVVQFMRSYERAIILNELMQQGLVETRPIGGQTYYTLKRAAPR